MRFLIVPAWQYPGTAVLCSFRLADKSLALGTHNDEIPKEFFPRARHNVQGDLPRAFVGQAPG
jgi:hypothetical protein